MYQFLTKPEVFDGWLEVFPPLNLNFRKCFWRNENNSTTFVENYFSSWQQNSIYLRVMRRVQTAFAVVCRPAYSNPYHLSGYLLDYTAPSVKGGTTFFTSFKNVL